jgi:hypothetical protein
MIPDATFEPTPGRSKFRPRFSLLALFVFMTLACLALAWLAQPKRVVATALFHVASEEPTLLGEPKPHEERKFESYKYTQLALLKSAFILQAAVRKPGIASLPILQSRPDAVSWLKQHLDVEFPQDAEILAIQLRGPESHASDLVQIVDAVAKAYQEEVIHGERTRRLAQRDLKSKSLQNLRNEIKHNLESLEAQNHQSGGKYKETAEGKLRYLGMDVQLNQLQELQRDLERADLEANAPSRIIQVQTAIVSPE